MPHGVRTAEAERRRLDKQADERVQRNDIEPVECANWSQRDACESDLELFGRTYFAPRLYLSLSAIHAKFILEFQTRILHGGRKALAAPRGSGKTTWTLIGILWALLYGHRHHILYLCGTTTDAQDRIELLKTWLETNDALHDDFPEVCRPIRALEHRPQRAPTQTWGGESTKIIWTRGTFALPYAQMKRCLSDDGAVTWEQSPASGGRIIGRGGDATIRGMLEDIGRPDFAAIDDPQSERSARSPSEIAARRKVIQKAIARLAGMGSSIAMLMLVTIIEKYDLADEFTDRERQPSWTGDRYRMLISDPTNAKLWGEYVQLRKQDQKDGDPYGRTAHAFYLGHRADMDVGAELLLPDAYQGRHVIIPPDTVTKNILPDGTEMEASALQACYNVIADDGEAVFWAELQNEPREDQPGLYDITPELVAGKVNPLARRIAPDSAPYLVAFIDVNPSIGLHWVVSAWQNDMTGYVLDYGRYPPSEPLWDPEKTPTVSAEQASYAGLQHLVGLLTAEIEWKRGNSAVRLNRVLIDCGWVMSTVFQFCRMHCGSVPVLPSRGRAGKKYREPNDKEKGGPVGEHWSTWYWKSQGGTVVVHDADYWREHAQRGFLLDPGAPSSISLWNDAAPNHYNFGVQIASRKLSDKKKGDSVIFYDWSNVPGRDDHWLDCLTGCCVAAGTCGAALDGTDKQYRQRKPPPRRRAKVGYAKIA